MEELKNKTADELLTDLKKIASSVNLEQLTEREKSLTIAIGNALSADQIRLLEKSLFLFECIDKERFLVENKIDKYIEQDKVELLLDKINKQKTNEQMVFMCRLNDYPRIIPSDVVEKINMLKKENIFDDYYVLYTDYTYKAEKIAKAEKIDRKLTTKSKKSKDPILFGVFIKASADKRTTYMHEKMYVIADWVDEYCDLTLDKLMDIAPEFVGNLYEVKSEWNLSEKDLKNLEQTEVGREIKAKLEKELSKNNSIKSVEKNKSFLFKLLRFFKR